MGPFKGNVPKCPFMLTPTPCAFWTPTTVQEWGDRDWGPGSRLRTRKVAGAQPESDQPPAASCSRALGSSQSSLGPDRLSLGARNLLTPLHQEPPHLGPVPRAPRGLTCPCCHTAAGSREAAARAPREPQTETWGPRSPQLPSQRPWLSLQGSTTQNSSCKRKHPG